VRAPGPCRTTRPAPAARASLERLTARPNRRRFSTATPTSWLAWNSMQVTLRSARLRSDGRLATWPPDLTRTTFPRRLRLVLLLDAEMSYRSEKRALRRALFTLEKTVCCRATWHTLVELTMIPVERHDCPPHSRAPVVDDIVTAASQQLPTYLCPVSSIRGLRLRRRAELARVTVRAVGPLRCARTLELPARQQRSGGGGPPALARNIYSFLIE
jgi:hypothetical protein